jgi:hypothetical protein
MLIGQMPLPENNPHSEIAEYDNRPNNAQHMFEIVSKESNPLFV